MQDRPCGDPECDGTASWEQDGDHCTYWACEECGYEFDYQQIVPQEGTCQVGIPESIRRAVGGLPQQHKGLPLLQIGRFPHE